MMEGRQARAQDSHGSGLSPWALMSWVRGHQGSNSTCQAAPEARWRLGSNTQSSQVLGATMVIWGFGDMWGRVLGWWSVPHPWVKFWCSSFLPHENTVSIGLNLPRWLHQCPLVAMPSGQTAYCVWGGADHHQSLTTDPKTG